MYVRVTRTGTSASLVSRTGIGVGKLDTATAGL